MNLFCFNFVLNGYNQSCFGARTAEYTNLDKFVMYRLGKITMLHSYSRVVVILLILV